MDKREGCRDEEERKGGREDKRGTIQGVVKLSGVVLVGTVVV
jgi:hypothetical protein